MPPLSVAQKQKKQREINSNAVKLQTMNAFLRIPEMEMTLEIMFV